MSDDPRPPVWVGHVAMKVSNPRAAHDYYVGLGMRPVLVEDDFAITELRGGTHLLLEAGETQPGDAPFDLMVEDLPATHERYREAGLDVSDIIPGEIHDVFVLTDPDGHRVVVYDDHSEGPV